MTAYLSKLLRSVFIAIFFGFLLVIVGGLSGSQKAQAINGAPSNFFPDVNPNGTRDVLAIVQIVSQNESNWATKMKAQTTLASIYVPESLVGSTINLTIIHGCDGNGLRDGNWWNGAGTDFRVNSGTSVNSHSCPGPATANRDIDYNFTAQATPYVVYDGPNRYYVQTFFAEAYGDESGPFSVRYLNSFQLRVNTPSVYAGISTIPTPCRSNLYPLSCPSSSLAPPTGYTAGVSYVYSSFYGSTDPSSMTINMAPGCSGGKGEILIYDLDGDVANLGQNLGMSITKNPGGSMGSLNHNQIVFLGGANNRQMHLPIPGIPAGDPDGYPLYEFAPNTVYTMTITGLSNDNAFQVLPYYIENPPSPGCGDGSGSASIVANCVAGSVSVVANITGEAGKDYVVVITQPNGVTQTRTRTGSGSLVFDNFTWPIDGIAASVTGTVALAGQNGKGAGAAQALTPGTFVCNPGGGGGGPCNAGEPNCVCLPSNPSVCTTCTSNCPPPVDSRCPENPGFFGADFWKTNSGVSRPLPAVVGVDGGYGALDYKSYRYKNDDLQNIIVTSSSGGVSTPLPHINENITVQANYQELVNNYPYDTHSVSGTANFIYIESFKKLIDVTATWTRTVKTADSYTTQQWSETSPGPAWYVVMQTGGETQLQWAASQPKGWTPTGLSQDDGNGNITYQYSYTTPIVYLWETVVPAVFLAENQTTTAYTRPLAPPRGAYPEFWNLVSAVARYEPTVETEIGEDATISFPTQTDCLYRKLTINLSSDATPSWNDLEAPTTASFRTELTAIFEPTDPGRTSLRAQNRVNSGSITFTPQYRVSNRPLLFQTSGTFTLPTSSPAIPFGGSTMGFETRYFYSTDIFAVSRIGGFGTPVFLDDSLCVSMTGIPQVSYVNSLGALVRSEGGTAGYEVGCGAVGCTVVLGAGCTINPPCTAFGNGICVENHPYFRFFNSDAVVSGMPFAPASPTPCTASGDATASIRGFNSGGGKGASSQVGLMAPGNISGVQSSIPSDITTGTRLTMANLGLSGDCLTNLYDSPSLSKTPGWPVNGVAGLVTNNAYQVNGDLSIAGGTVPSGVRSAVYVNGDVTITGNIDYAGSGGYASTSAMPYFMIVATGSININRAVISVDAVLVSQSGMVSTCTQTDPACLQASGSFTLNGAVVANKLRPLRMSGTPVLGNANEQPGNPNIGDTFRMIPEVILATPPLPKDNGTLKYDSITELPPIF